LPFEKACQSENDPPNYVTYGTIMKAIGRLEDGGVEERDVLLKPIFEKCKEQGLVERFVLTQFRTGCSLEAFQECVLIPAGFGPINGYEIPVRMVLERLPKAWRSNLCYDR